MYVAFFFILITACMSAYFVALANVDRAIRHLYETNRELWETKGKPSGWFLELPNSSWLARQSIMTELMFCSPAWVKSAETVRRAQRRYRIAALVASFIVILAGATMMFADLTGRL